MIINMYVAIVLLYSSYAGSLTVLKIAFHIATVVVSFIEFLCSEKLLP